MQTFNLDLSIKRIVPLLYAKQRDVGSKICIVLTDNQENYTIPNDAQFSVWYSGKSGSGNYTDIDGKSAFAIEGNTVTVELIYQMLNNPGEHLMCLVMNGADGKQQGLWNIPYFVEAIPGADSEAATAYYNAFLDAQEKAEEAADRAEAAADRAESAGGAGGDAKPKDVIVTAEFEAAFPDGATGSMVANGASSMTALAIATAIRGGATVKLIDNDNIVYEYDGYRLEPSNTMARFKAEVPTEEGIKVYRVNIDNELYAGKVERLVAYGGGGDSYYSTTREELGVSHENVTAEYIYGLYDALMAEHPDNVQKNAFTVGTFTNYEYVISTGEYTTDALYTQQYGADPHIKKPKYIILSGIHGTERNAALSAYRFIRDVLSGHNVPQSFKEGAIIHIMPVGTPSAINAFTRENEGGVDINRNFGSASPENETQAIKNWLNANADADLYIDLHNNGQVNEVVAILGDSSNECTETVKKIALKGVDRIIPYWKTVIGYPPVEAPYLDGNEIKTEVRDVIFSYCADVAIEGSSQLYASKELSIPSITIELSIYYGDYSDRDGDTKYPPETIAAGAEAIGNILLEFYEQSFVGEVIDDMKEVNDKLDDLLAQVNSGFHVESGVLVVGADVTDPTDSIIEIKIPCTNGAKMLTFQPDGDTLNIITQNTSADDGVNWLVGAMGNCVTQVGSRANRGYMQRMDNLVYGGKNYWTPTEVGGACDNSDGFTLSANGLKAGTYNWTAYYWNE